MKETQKNNGCLTLATDNDEFKYAVRFDGCLHIHRHWYDNPQDVDYIHICDVEQFIKDLQEVVTKAREHFGNQWPNV